MSTFQILFVGPDDLPPWADQIQHEKTHIGTSVLAFLIEHFFHLPDRMCFVFLEGCVKGSTGEFVCVLNRLRSPNVPECDWARILTKETVCQKGFSYWVGLQCSLSSPLPKVLLIDNDIHFKNKNAIRRYSRMEWVYADSTQIHEFSLLSNCGILFDLVMSPAFVFSPRLFSAQQRILFGPHCSVFPTEELMETIVVAGFPNVYYNVLSGWVNTLWKSFSFAGDLQTVAIPFGVETDVFVDDSRLPKTCIFVYYKRRDPDEMQQVVNFLGSQMSVMNRYLKIENCVLFNYSCGYSEHEFLNVLRTSHFGIWLDAHESQGFALQEALSCNVPLFVWNVGDMSQEMGSSYSSSHLATTVPYWSAECGVVVDEFQEEAFWSFFGSVVENKFSPRGFVVENLSISVCEDRLLELFS